MAAKLKFSNVTLYLILIGIILGFVLGHFSPHTALELEFLGDIFLNALFMMVVPLVVASMVTGIARLGHIKQLGTLGMRTIVYYMITTGISVIIGIILVNIIQPGKDVSRQQDYHPQAQYQIKPLPLSGGS
jgi:Na+/H+-dicarboxylate symporter